MCVCYRREAISKSLQKVEVKLNQCSTIKHNNCIQVFSGCLSYQEIVLPAKHNDRVTSQFSKQLITLIIYLYLRHHNTTSIHNPHIHRLRYTQSSLPIPAIPSPTPSSTQHHQLDPKPTIPSLLFSQLHSHPGPPPHPPSLPSAHSP